MIRGGRPAVADIFAEPAGGPRTGIEIEIGGTPCPAAIDSLTDTRARADGRTFSYSRSVQAAAEIGASSRYKLFIERRVL
jgi:hypothetical protein